MFWKFALKICSKEMFWKCILEKCYKEMFWKYVMKRHRHVQVTSYLQALQSRNDTGKGYPLLPSLSAPFALR